MPPADVQGLDALEPVGSGTSGRVFHGWDAAGRGVAIKIFDSAVVNRALLEEAASRLAEAGWPEEAMAEYGADYQGAEPVRVMPLMVDSESGAPASLQHRLAAFPGQDSWPTVQGILKALAVLHDRRVAHGNLKPGNVFFRESGGVVLTDWALGNMPDLAGKLEYTDAVLYQPPEQLRDPAGYLREKGYRWDVFAFGVLAYRLLTGNFPRAGTTFSQVAPEPGVTRRTGIAADLTRLARLLESQPEVPWPDAAANPLEEAYREILVRCLALDPALRPATAGEVLGLFSAAERVATSERSAERVLDQRRHAQRGSWRANVAAALLTLAVVVLAGLWQLTRSQARTADERRLSEVAKREEDLHDAERRLEGAKQREMQARQELTDQSAVWLARIESSRAIGDRLFAWAMEKGHRKLPPLDGRDQRLSRLELYFQDFVTRTGEMPALKEERARARLQLAEVSLAKGDAANAARRLEEAMADSGNLPVGPDLDLRVATDRLLLALLLQERADPAAQEAFDTARRSLEKVPLAEVDADRVRELLAVLDFHESRLLAAAGQDGLALEKLHGATQVLNQLVEQRPDAVVLRSELCLCYLSSATILDGIGQMGDAREVRSLAAEELLKLLKQNPGDLALRQELAGCYGAMAEAAALSGDLAGTDSMSTAAVRLLEDLLSQRPDNVEVRSQLAAQRAIAAGVLRDRGQRPQALKLIDDGILLVEGLAIGDAADSVAKYRLAMLWWQKGRMIGAEGKRTEEIELETKSMKILRKLADSDYGTAHMEQTQHSMGYVLGDLGHAAQLAGDRALSEASFSEAVVVWEKLARDRPQNEEYDEALAWTRRRLKELRETAAGG